MNIRTAALIAHLVLRFGLPGLHRLLNQINPNQSPDMPRDRDIEMLAQKVAPESELESEFELVNRVELEKTLRELEETKAELAALKAGSNAKKSSRGAKSASKPKKKQTAVQVSSPQQTSASND